MLFYRPSDILFRLFKIRGYVILTESSFFIEATNQRRLQYAYDLLSAPSGINETDWVRLSNKPWCLTYPLHWKNYICQNKKRLLNICQNPNKEEKI